MRAGVQVVTGGAMGARGCLEAWDDGEGIKEEGVEDEEEEEEEQDDEEMEVVAEVK
jgi:hypothetical protein